MSRLKIAALTVAAALLLLIVLAFDRSPALPPAAAPTGAQVRDGRDSVKRLRDALRAPPPSATITITDLELRGIAALAGDLAHIRRADARLDAGRAVAAASLDLPLGLWLNLRVAAADVAGSGFPRLDVSVGDLTLPRWLTRAGVGAVRSLLVLRGGRLPPLDRIVLGHRGTAERVVVTIGTPLDGTGMVRQLVGLGGAQVDGTRVALLYCRLAAAQRRSSEPTLAGQVRRGAAFANGQDAAAENRALLVALAMLTVGPRAADLADDAAGRATRCFIDPPGLTLGGRADLAKHWALSAALGATVGGDVTRAMGEWKELSDSMAGGSGFSFVDLAADRAGLRVGRAAATPANAAAMRAALAGASDAGLLPLDAATLREGMTNAAFTARYGSIDDRDFATAVAAIDRLLDRNPMLLAARQ